MGLAITIQSKTPVLWIGRGGGGVKSVNPQLAKCSYISDIYQFYGGIIYETNINGIKIHFSQKMHAISKEYTVF